MIVRTHAIIFRYVYRIVVFSFIRHQLGGKLQMPLVMGLLFYICLAPLNFG